MTSTVATLWAIRRASERRNLQSSLEMARALEAVAERIDIDRSAAAKAADEVRSDVQKQRASFDALSVADFGALAWATLRNEVKSSKQLQSRHVGLLQGILLGDLEAVGHRVAAANRYLTELGDLCGVPWDGVALPGVADEHERHHGSVRFAFASSGFWDLPVLAHEFGHVVEGTLLKTGLNGVDQSLPWQELVERLEQQRQRPASVVREYLSDAFGVYVAGPAYVCALVLLRLDPSADPRLDVGGTHPSDGRRAAAACEALRRLDDEDGPFTAIAQSLSTIWEELTAAAGGDRPDDPSNDLLMLDEIWPQFRAMPRARFTTSRHAHAAHLEQHIDDDDDQPSCLVGDLLEAAWMARLRLVCAGSDVDPKLGNHLLARVAFPSIAGRKVTT